MSKHAHPHDRKQSTVSKSLDELDETDGDGRAHYSADEIAQSCHAAAGQSHGPPVDEDDAGDHAGEGRR